jgi:hypothetical protein
MFESNMLENMQLTNRTLSQAIVLAWLNYGMKETTSSNGQDEKEEIQE